MELFKIQTYSFFFTQRVGGGGAEGVMYYSISHIRTRFFCFLVENQRCWVFVECGSHLGILR